MRRTWQAIWLCVAIPWAVQAVETGVPGAASVADRPGIEASASHARPACAPDPASTGEAPAPRASNRIAISFDDLPWVMDRNQAPPDLVAYHGKLLAALARSCIPAIGFVNDGKLYQGETLRPERVDMLRDWLDAGLELGNHTAWHGDLHALGPQGFQADIAQGERHLKPLLAERGLAPRWFRHPFLHTGRSPEDKAAVEAFLAAHGYRTAPVTINTTEWTYALAYRNLLSQGGDADTLARLRRDYVDYMLSEVAYYERRSVQLLGYNVPQVLLLHANELNADTFGDLVAGIRARGYRFVGLDEAVADPAFSRPDYDGAALGTSWIHRWARNDRNAGKLYFGKIDTPRWILELANGGSGGE